jgi:DNA-binding NarL/FixJ family response regulator
LFERGGAYPAAQLGRAALLLERDDPAGAAVEVERFLRQTPAEDRTGRVAGLELAVRAQATLGNAEDAAARLVELEQVVARVGTVPLQASARAAQGVVAAARGDHRSASQRLEEAVDLYQRSAAPFEAARARLELARELAQLGQRVRARAEAVEATRTLRQLGAARAVEHAGLLVRELAVSPERPAGKGLLTPRQLEILRLVSQGWSNAEIAARLSLSEHTVKRHVANLLTRLGLKSRAAAAAKAAKLGLL